MRTPPHHWISALRGAVLVLGAGATVACGGGTTRSFWSSAPADVQTTVPLTLSTVAGGPAVGMALPEPLGYSSRLTVQYASVQPGTTVAVGSSVSNAGGLPGLTTSVGTFRNENGVRHTDPTAVEYAVVLSLVLVFATDVIANGIATFTQAVPPESLGSSTSYSLAYEDNGPPDAGWVIIAGPVRTTDGSTLTFSANVPATTFQAGQQYEFAIVSSTP